MAVRIGPRSEVRLDEGHRKALAEVLEARGLSTAAFVRQAIDEERERLAGGRVKAMLRKLQEDPVDWGTPEELNAELAHAHCSAPEFCGEPEKH